MRRVCAAGHAEAVMAMNDWTSGTPSYQTNDRATAQPYPGNSLTLYCQCLTLAIIQNKTHDTFPSLQKGMCRALATAACCSLAMTMDGTWKEEGPELTMMREPGQPTTDERTRRTHQDQQVLSHSYQPGKL